MCLLNPVVLFESSAKPQVRLGKRDECLLRGYEALSLSCLPSRSRDTVFAVAVVQQEGSGLTVSGWRCSAPLVRWCPFQSAALTSFCSAVTLKDIVSSLEI